MRTFLQLDDPFRNGFIKSQFTRDAHPCIKNNHFRPFNGRNFIHHFFVINPDRMKIIINPNLNWHFKNISVLLSLFYSEFYRFISLIIFPGYVVFRKTWFINPLFKKPIHVLSSSLFNSFFKIWGFHIFILIFYSIMLDKSPKSVIPKIIL